jgi:trehalose 2-sulfotransferase
MLLPPELIALRPSRAYLVCATPSSGGTLLCAMLAELGTAGWPAEHVETLRLLGRPNEPREYFAGVADRDVLGLLPVSAPPQVYEAPIAGRLCELLRYATTADGVFGTRVMWGYLHDLQERLAELPELAALDDAARLRAVLGDVRFVHVTREDHVAQASSMWRALQMGAPVYAFAAIDHLVRMLDAHEAGWLRWFSSHGISPLQVSYEALAADPPGQLRRVLEFIGLPHALAAPPLMRGATDGRSALWAERYRADASLQAAA